MQWPLISYEKPAAGQFIRKVITNHWISWTLGTLGKVVAFKKCAVLTVPCCAKLKGVLLLIFPVTRVHAFSVGN